MPDTANISDSEDTDSAHLPKIKPMSEWLKPIPEEDRPKTPKPDWYVPTNDLLEPENNWADALAKAYKDPEENKLLRKTCDMGSFITWFCKIIGKKKLNQVDLVNPEGHQLVPDVSKPLPLGGPPGQVTIRSQFFFNKDLEYLVSGDKGRRSALSISKLKASQYLDFGLEELVPSLWIKSEREYDISVAYADYKEYKISKADFKNLHPNDFEDLYLLHLQGQLNHLSGDNKDHLFNATKLNLTQLDWDASDFLFKEDYTIVSKPRAVIYRDKNDQKKMMRETEEYNKGMETRIWSEDDRRRSKDFMKVIERMLKIRRIFRSLESFVGGRLRDVDYRLIQITE
ncbi:hypothetical protein Tco_1033687 [Tanacetum coccineum]